MVEGTVAMAVVFVLLAFLVQLAFLVNARSVAQAAVDAHARKVAVTGVDGEAAFVADLQRSIPGVRHPEAYVTSSGRWVEARLQFSWDPPGPVFVPVVVSVSGVAPIIDPP